MSFRIALLLLSGSVLLAPAPALAVTDKVALVIANGSYGQGTARGCSRLGQDVADALEADAFKVEAVVDGSIAMIQSSILQFAQQLEGAQKVAIAYICSQVATRDGRLFLVPAHIGIHGFERPQTQGLVIKSVMNALDGRNGVLLADLLTTNVAEARALDGWTSPGRTQVALSLSGDFSGDIGKNVLAHLARPASERTSFPTFLADMKERSDEMTSVFALTEAKPAPQLFGPVMPPANAATPVPETRPTEIAEPQAATKAKPQSGRKKRAKGPGTKKRQSDVPLFFGLFGNERRSKK
ncbi:hypothetical protein ACK9YZ_31395 [Rhizobium sp. ZK1]|uniref:hypothetical protein n=1 Tax=Rhizobium sp. ZK1 TaxID=3389872 RepID=UPI0039F66F9C